MSIFLDNLILGLLIVALVALLLAYRQGRRARQALESCANLLQEIFMMMGEPSAVTRILSQETPEEELTRLKYLLEKQTFAALIESAIFRRILGGLPDGLVTLDTTRNIIFCNSKYCHLTGIPVASHAGKKLFEVLRQHAALKAAEHFLAQTEETFAEIEFMAASGKTLKMRMVKLTYELSPLFLFAFSDVSGLKKLEAVRRDFVTNVSHELRTPLTSIQGFVETLLDDASVDPSTRHRFLELIKNDAERLRRLIEDLLALARIENQGAGIEKQPLKVLAETEEVLEFFSLRLRQKQLRVEKKIDEGVLLSANRDQFRQVLVNLFDNAVKFTPENGAILVLAEQRDSHIEIRVTDSGPGIRAENREKIFQRFFREDKARSRETGGTGLGLAIVKHIMEAHSGTVHCEENLSGGSVFVLTFPAS